MNVHEREPQDCLYSRSYYLVWEGDLVKGDRLTRLNQLLKTGMNEHERARACIAA